MVRGRAWPSLFPPGKMDPSGPSFGPIAACLLLLLLYIGINIVHFIVTKFRPVDNIRWLDGEHYRKWIYTSIHHLCVKHVWLQASGACRILLRATCLQFLGDFGRLSAIFCVLYFLPSKPSRKLQLPAGFQFSYVRYSHNLKSHAGGGAGKQNSNII